MRFEARLIATMATAIMIAGCSSIPVSMDKANQVPKARTYWHKKIPDKYATVEITRNRTTSVFKGCLLHVKVDDRSAVDIKEGEGAAFRLAPGKHLVGVSNATVWCGPISSTTMIDAHAGQTILLNVQDRPTLRIKRAD